MNAMRSVILQTEVGSTAWGLSLDPMNADSDQMGIVIEPFEEAVGLGSPFEVEVSRTATLRTGNHDEPSQAGDIDLCLYSLRKWMRLALKGNPTVLTLLFAPQAKWIKGDSRGGQLQDLAPLIVSRLAGKAFLGYLQAQRMRLTGERGGSHGATHAKDQAAHGYDTKYAMHMLRLGVQGIELLTSGKMSMPLQEKERGILLGVRRGESSYQDVLTLCGSLEADLKDLLDDSPLQAEPNTKKVEEWMLEVYWAQWQAEYGQGYQQRFKDMVWNVNNPIKV